MKSKALVTATLLTFVAFSIVWLVAKEVMNTAAVDPLASPEGSLSVSEQEEVVTATYFYGDIRCQTCRNIEAYTAETITGTFTNEIAAKRLSWTTINTDDPENEHFIEDYDLSSRAVVLVRMEGGQQVEWKKLDRIWDLVGDKEAFQSYIVAETTAFLNKSSS